MPNDTRTAIRTNRLLQALDDDIRDRLDAAGESVDFEQREILAEPSRRHQFVHFPGDAVISLLTPFRDGSAVEVGTVGCEGMADLSVFLGNGITHVRVMVQIPGEALRVPATSFNELIEAEPPLRAVMGLYAQAFLSQVLQSAACNASHPIVARCARWLLMTHDRVGSRQFALTHELLAYMLGVRRAGVTEAAGSLQDAGYIRYGRGRVEIVDRDRLEAAACECYGIIRRTYDSLLGGEVPA